MNSSFFLGLDLGQARDFTAFTLTECVAPAHEPREPPAPHWSDARLQRLARLAPHESDPKPAKARYFCRKLKRVRGVPYHEIVDHCVAVMN